jgi:hypothetical protein
MASLEGAIMTRLFLVLPLALSACAALTGAPRPEAARITGGTLAVRFTDGSTCRAALAPAGGEGAFPDCGGAVYAVAITGPNILEPLLGKAVDPYAVVTVTDAGGAVTRFKLPVSREAGFDAIRVN